MPYFDQEYLQFFTDLEINNNRDWFHANKKTYEKKVKGPFKAFTTDLIKRLGELWGIPEPMEAKKAIMRINRDIRFSKDKTPYKIHMAAMINKNGSKDGNRPGMFFQANHIDTRVYSGCHSLEKDDLLKVRNYIANNLDQFDGVINDKQFKSAFGNILGEKHKRLPKELQGAAEKQPLIFNKGYYYFSSIDARNITDEDYLDQIISRYQDSLIVGDFLEKALNQ